jgi:metallo-beta-lactamase class B
MRRFACLAILLTPLVVFAQAGPGRFISAEQDASLKGPDSEPIEPFRILANIHYVGAQNISSYLITTPQGHILVDTGMPRMAKPILANVEKLGFKPNDIRLMISSHAHVDHIGGHAEVKKATGAQVIASAEDAKALEAGVDMSPVEYDGWTPVRVDRIIKDGETVSLGGTTLRAVLTPGHTPGATTWVMDVQDGGRSYHVVFPGGAAPNGGPLVVGNPKHPNLDQITLNTYAKLKKLNPDIVLPGHPQGAFKGKIDQIKSGARPHPLLQEPGAWLKQQEQGEANFRKRIEADKAKVSTR